MNRSLPIGVSAALLALALAALLPACGRHAAPTAPVAPPACEVTPSSLDFGHQALGAPGETLSFMVKNVGGGTLVARVGGVCGAFQVACGCGNLALGAGDSQVVAVRFVPTRLGSASCTFAVGDSGTCSGVACTGTAIRAGTCWLSTTTLAFGSVAVDSCSADRTFTLRNSGEAVLAGTVPDSAGPFRVTAGAGPFALEAGGSREVAVRFCPGREGAAAADLGLGSSICTVSLSGTGTLPPPACNLSATLLEFGSVPVGTCSERTFRVLNVGAGPLSGNVPASCGPFQVVAGAGAFTLPAGGSLAVTVRFCPTTGTRSECQLSLGTSCASVACVGSGGCLPKLAINSRPTLARVTLDNVALGVVTPCTLSVTAGSHTLSLTKTGYSYFSGPSPITVPCSGTMPVTFVGHHRTYYVVDNGTLLDPAHPSTNACTDTTFRVGPGAAGGPTELLFCSTAGAADSRVSVFEATLSVKCMDCTGPDGAVPLTAQTPATSWSACAATWDAPGTTWGSGDVAVGRKFSSYVQFNVTATVAGWADGTKVNRGWAIVPTDPAWTRRFYSPRHPTEYPSLVVDWTER